MSMNPIHRILEHSAGHPSPAYLFVGPPKSEKRALAEAFAAALLRHEHEQEQTQMRMHPDCIVLSAEEGKKQISVEQVRAMRERLFSRPMQAPRLVAYLPHADQLNESGMNALLKVLEEPPAGAVCILVVEDMSRLPATVISRCVVLRCAAPPRGNSPSLLEQGEGFASTFIGARTLGARLAQIDRLSKACDAADDAQVVWRDALLDAMRFSCATSEGVVLGVALLAALRFVGGPVSPRLALEAAAIRLGESDLDEQARHLLPTHVPRTTPLLFGDLVYSPVL